MRTALTTAGLALALMVLGSMPSVSTTTTTVSVCKAATVEEQAGYCEFCAFCTCIDDQGVWNWHFEGFVGPPEP